MGIRIVQRGGVPSLHMEGFLDSDAASEVRQAFVRLQRSTAREAIRVVLRDVSFLSKEVLDEIRRGARELARTGDGLRLVEVPKEIRAFLLAAGILREIPSDPPALEEEFLETRRAWNAASERALLIVEPDPREWERLAAVLLVRGYAVTRAKRLDSVPSAVRSGLGVVLPMTAASRTFEGLRRFALAGARVLAVVGKGETVLFEKAALLGAKSVETAPLEPRALLAFAAALSPVSPLSSTGAETPDRSLAENEPIPKKRILVVDDSMATRRRISRLLEPEYDWIEAETAAMGIAYAEEYRPDAILLDLVMPGMNGITALERIRENPSLRDIPVLVITSVTEKEKVVECLRRKAADYLVKPLEAANLKARIERVLRRSPTATMSPLGDSDAG